MPKFLAYRLRQMPRPRRDFRYGSMPPRDLWDAHWQKYVGSLEGTYRIKVPNADSSVERYGLANEYTASELYSVTSELCERMEDDSDAGDWAARILRVLGFDWV